MIKRVEGPLGNVSFSIDVSRDDIDEDVTLRDLDLRGHSIRNYSPEEFLLAVSNTDEEYLERKGRRAKTIARRFLEIIEDGRFEEMLSNTHTFFVFLDRDEKIDWAARNPRLMEWVGVWGWLNDQDWFPEIQEEINGINIEQRT